MAYVRLNRDEDEVSMHSMFLFHGAVSAYSKLSDEQRDNFSGQLGLAHWLASNKFAELLCDASDALFAMFQDFPGVFEYEVSEDFGAWLAVNCCEHEDVNHEVNGAPIYAALAALCADFMAQFDSVDKTQMSVLCSGVTEDFKNGIRLEDIVEKRVQQLLVN